MTRTSDLFAAVQAWAADHYPGFQVARLALHLQGPGREEKVLLPVPSPAPAAATRNLNAVFVPNGFQRGILEALNGRAMKADALGHEVGDRRRLFKKGGLPELRQHDLVESHPRLGYYRPDAPPPELADDEAEGG